AAQDPPRCRRDPLPGRTLGDEPWIRRRGGAQERGVDDGRHPSAQRRPGRPGNLGRDEDGRRDVQPRDGTGRVSWLTSVELELHDSGRAALARTSVTRSLVRNVMPPWAQ